MNPLIPVYYQIKQTIRNWIIRGEFNPGERIPSENQLADQFRVTRLTVRQAVSQLSQEGLIISRRGNGTFVTDNENLVNSLTLESTAFMEEAFYQVQKTETKSATINRIISPRLVSEKLKLGTKQKEVVQIKRVRFLKGKSFTYITNYLPVQIGAKIIEEELYRKSLLQILQQDLCIQFTEAFQTIEASFADQEMAEALGIPSGSPMLFVERTMYTKKRTPVSLSQVSYRGDLFKYVARFKNVKRKKGNIWIRSSL